PALTAVTDVNVSLSGNASVTTAQVQSITANQQQGYSVAISGRAYDFSGLTSLDGQSVLVSGGISQTLPGVASLRPGWQGALQASGAGSVLALPNLTAVTENGTFQWLDLFALSGGTVRLAQLANLSDAPNNLAYSGFTLKSDGTGSLLDLPALTQLTD